MVRTRFIGSGRLQEGGFLGTHKQDFEAHRTGGDWRHDTTQVDMASTIVAYPGTNVQETLELMAAGITGTPNLSTVLAEGNSAGALTIDMNNQYIRNLRNPTNGQDATTKFYVDQSILVGVGSISLSNVLSHGNSTGGYNIDLRSGSEIYTTDIGGSVSIRAGSGAAGVPGGNLILRSGVGSSSVTGNISMYTPDGPRDGGTISIYTADNASYPSGNILIRTGSATANSPGDILIATGNATGAFNSGDLTLLGGSGGLRGGNIAVLGGGTGSTGTDGGYVQISGGAATSTTGTGGNVNIYGGDGGGAGTTAGSITIRSGANSSATPGNITIQTPTAGTGGAGDILIQGGNGGGGDGGAITIETVGVATGQTGDISITTGDAGGGRAGNITLTTGDAAFGGGTYGTITLRTGYDSSTGYSGTITFRSDNTTNGRVALSNLGRTDPTVYIAGSAQSIIESQSDMWLETGGGSYGVESGELYFRGQAVYGGYAKFEGLSTDEVRLSIYSATPNGPTARNLICSYGFVQL